MTNAESEHGAHCGRRHKDWPDVAQHLVDDFPEAPLVAIVQEVNAAKQATDAASVEEMEALEVGEIIARHHLLLSLGRLVDVARLDPESRRSRSRG